MRFNSQKALLVVSFLVLPMAAVAMVGDTTTTSKQSDTAVTTQNQGTTTQVTVQNTVQTNNPETGTMTQSQEQDQLGKQIQQSQPETVTAKSSSQGRTDITASAIENLVKFANKLENEGVADQIREIASIQGDSVDKANKSLEKVESRNGLIEFFIGPNYGELKTIKGEIEKNQLRIRELQTLRIQLANEGDQEELQVQINLLEQQNINLENELDSNDGGFSLFGWFFKLVNRY